MFSYRHAFHAGNHADVLKHFIQVQLHKYMNQKDTAYTYIDTHAGAGVYALDSAQAVKSGEYVDGIARLWDEGRGFAAIRTLWLERAAGVGAPVSIRIANDLLAGTFETIDGEGRLVVRAPDGSERTVSAGEVHLGTEATAR